MMVIMMLLRVMLMLTMNTVVFHVVTSISTAHNALLLKALCFCEPGQKWDWTFLVERNVFTWWGCKLLIWLCRQRPGRWTLSPPSKDPCNPPESWQSPQNEGSEDKDLHGNKVGMHGKMCTQNRIRRLLTVLLSGGSKVESCHTVKL